ncbi:PLxRFG domain-containing protein [Allomesorhizobium alhagi]|uniref:Peptidase M15A C-terminal domain-containing protein n=1 Tax=Mesorhizobium alhagi CCNWXJ12-2 TaxID=1107882 RepID=H0HNG4_9HYPH|nr:PLxRFG domain-containing protein [Mesorhizobium alhagi]EHK57736.1 hypothetical protein MAXJ12_08434 [Mesorhizobium alhagi CCNWXJ12-2]
MPPIVIGLGTELSDPFGLYKESPGLGGGQATQAPATAGATPPAGTAATPPQATAQQPSAPAGAAIPPPNDSPDLPAGMRNNNPGNIKYRDDVPWEGLLGPSVNTDQGDPQAVFDTPEKGMRAAAKLAVNKYAKGLTTPLDIIAGDGGWTPGNTRAAANIAATMGVAPNEDMRLDDPARLQKFMRALVTQEHGKASSLYPDELIASTVTALQQEMQSAPPAAKALDKLAAGGKGDGMLEPGNIDLHNRPVVKNADGSISTVRSVSFNIGGNEVLIPTVSPDGKILSNEDALRLYKQTGQHLGKFATPEAATKYAERLHDDQAEEYLPGVSGDRVRGNPDAKGFARLTPPETVPPSGKGGKLHFRHAGQDKLEPGFQSILADASAAMGRDFTITSGYRSPDHPVEARKKSGPGEHSRHHASDISMKGMNEEQRAQLVAELHARGVKRFGIYKNSPDMLHVDMKDQTGDGSPWFMYDTTNKKIGQAPGWFRRIAAGDMPEAGARAAPQRIAVGADYKPRDPMGLYSTGANPFAQSGAPAEDAAPPEPEPVLDPRRAGLEQSDPGRYTAIDESEYEAWKTDWEERNRSTGLGGDTTRLLKSGAAGLALGAREAVAAIPKVGPSIVEGLDSISEWIKGDGVPTEQRLERAQQKAIASMTPETIAARGKDWVTETTTEEGAVQYTAGPAWRDPRSYFGGLVESVPGTVMSMGPSMFLARGAFKAAIARGATQKQAAAAAARTATIAGGISEGTISGGMAARGVREQIAQIPTQALQESDAVQQLMAEGMSFDQAVETLTNDAAAQTFVIAGVATGAFGGIGDRALAKIVAEGVGGSVGKRILRGAGRGVVAEGLLEEAPQEAAQQAAQNLGVQGIDPSQRISEGVANAAAGGLAVGGTMGAGMGGAGGAARRAPESPPQPKKGPLTSALESAQRQAAEKAANTFTVNDPAMGDMGSGDLHGQNVTLDPNQTGVPAGMRRVRTGDGTQRVLGERLLVQQGGAVPAAREQPKTAPAKPAAMAVPSGAPAIGATVRVDADGVPPFMARVESYEGDEAVLYDSASGEVYQVPVSNLTQIADKVENLPPVLQEKTAPDALPERPVPTVITRGMRANLGDLGWSEDAVRKMTPAEADEILRNGSHPAGSPVDPNDAALEPQAPQAADSKSELPPRDKQKPAMGRFPGPPKPGQRVIVDAPGIVERFAGRIEAYEEGATEALVTADDGRSLQVPVEHLYVDGTTRKEAEAEDLRRDPPVEREPVTGGTSRKVFKHTLVMPDEKHAALYDLGKMRRESQRMVGASALDRDKVMPAEQIKLADAFGVTPEALGQIADDYRYRVERASKEARSELPVKMHAVNAKRLKQWQAERDKAAGGLAAPATDQVVVDNKLDRGEPQDAPLADDAIDDAAFDAAAAIDVAAHQAATSPENDRPEPSQAQKEAGNYALGHARLGGLDISIENPAGSERKGVSRSGKAWSVTMKSHYGYFKGTVGRDKDHIDAFIKPGTAELDDSAPVFVVDQRDPSRGQFDEHKVMVGYGDEAEARAAYLENYTKGWKGLGAITETTLGGFKAWLEGDTTKPFAKSAPAAAVDPAEVGTIPTQVGTTPESPPQPIEPTVTETVTPVEKPASEQKRASTEKSQQPAKKPKAPPLLGRLENYFRPGRIVSSYGGGEDRVIGFDRRENGNWQVRVIQVGPDGEPLPRERERTHSTAPTGRDLDRWEKDNPVPAPSKTTKEGNAAAVDALFANNKLFTADKVEAARARLKAKMSQINSGVDPETLIDGMTIAGAYIESGVRAFADFATRMTADFGEGIRPYLLSFWEGARNYPGLDAAGMTDPQESARLAGLSPAELAAIVAQEAAEPAVEAESGPEQVEPAVQTPDRAGIPADAAGQEPAAQSRPSQANPGDVEKREPNNVGRARAQRDDGQLGLRLTAEDVGPDGAAAGQRDGGDGRPRDGGTGTPDARAGDAGDDAVGRRVGGTGGSAAGGPGDARRVPSQPELIKQPETVSPANAGPGDFHIDDPLRVVGGGQVARFEKNRAAIDMRNTLIDDGRKPTREEQEVLAGYTGWGSFGQELFQGTWERPAPKAGWEARDTWLRENLGQKEWEGLQRSIINAHYTDPPTVLAMWDMVRRMGFTGGRVLEPSIGIGNFYGMMPVDMAARSQRAGVELDPVTGSMAQLLYPNAAIQIKGYEQSTTPDDFYDLVIGNWPFADYSPADRRYNRLSPLLHDYFFLKALDQVRPGGLVVGITTKGTMDKKASSIRNAMAKKAELVAAFRLPTGAFEEYAGTKVVTDIIILRKRAEPAGIVANEGWIQVKDHATPEGTPIAVNEYFHNNPSHVIGEIDFGSGMNRAGLVVRRPANVAEELRRVIDLVPEGAYQADTRGKQISYIANHTNDRTNSLVKTKDGLFIVRGEHMAAAEEVHKYSLKSATETAERVAQLEALVGMRKLYGALIEAERTGAAEDARKALRDAFAAFRKAHGNYSKSFGLQYLKKIDDPFYPALAALESSTPNDKGGRSYRPASILTESTIRGARKLENPSVPEAFVLARNESVNPTPERIAELAGKTVEEVRSELIDAGAAFSTPAGEFIPADLYLSGNVREKMRQARAGLEGGNEDMQRNVAALQEVIPADIPYYKIETQLGATWVPPHVYGDFIAHMLGLADTSQIKVGFNAGAWRIDFPGEYNHRTEASAGFGTPHVKFKRLVRAAIANQTITVKHKDSDGKEYVDEQATKETNAKISEMRLKFGEWLWSDPERRVDLEQEYNETRNAYATPSFDGSFLTFQGMALSVGRGPFNLREHQVNAIWRALVTRKSLNAHEVGTGKAQPLDAKILTPSGWKRMGDIQVGDQVVTQSGQPTTVEAVFPQGEKEIFRVVFSDGSSTECCDEHLWLTQTYRERNQAINAKRAGKDWGCAKPKVRSLAEIRETLVSPHLAAKNHSIPIVGPVQLTSRPVPLDPYLMGVLLGDGGMSHRSATITNMDEEIVQGLVLPENVELRRQESAGRCPTWALRMKKLSGFGASRKPNPAVVALEQLGLMGKGAKDKFIPENYLFNDIEARIALLQGLMDTDGSALQGGYSVYYYTVSDRLADDVVALVQSLGGTVSRTTKTPKYRHNGEARDGALAHILCIKLPPQINPFRLERKAALVKPKEKYRPVRYIVDIQPVGRKPAQCIRVSDSSHLYVTDDFVVTHNTFTMGGIAVESRRYGIAKKPLLFAHNANSKTVAHEIQQMYPAAKVLYVDNLSKDNIKVRMMQIANDDWDVVVLPHSLIDRIGFKEETLMVMAQQEIDDLEAAANEAAEDDGVEITKEMLDDPEELKKLRSVTAKHLVKQRQRIISTIQKLGQQSSRDDSVSFEDLGVDMVLVDEAHEFKKPPIATKMNMKGLQTQVSNRSISMSFVTKYVRGMNNGGNVHLFTGTPITNTMTEVFHMMRYMMLEEMEQISLADWDGWFGSFAREVEDVELSSTNEYETVTRLSAFINVPELRRMIGQYMDVVFSDDMPEMLPRSVNGKTMADKDLTAAERAELLNGRTEGANDRPYKKVINDSADMSAEQMAVFAEVQSLARQWRSMTKKARKDAMAAGDKTVPIIHDAIAEKASFDVRLVDAIENAGLEGTPEMEPHPLSKPARVVAKLIEIYRSDDRATQAVFMEQGMARSVSRSVGAPGEKTQKTYKAFSTLVDMVERLVQAGIPREQIATVTGATSKDKRKEIAEAMNAGTIRIVFGSTDSLGVGVNMQRNLRAMHHMDAPWMPGDLEQRNGRGHRQGNQWNTVLEHRYLTDRLDGRRWQVLAIKQRFITDFMKSSGDTRVIEGDAASDEQSDILSTFADAAGDPRILLREKYKKKLDQLQSRERMHGHAMADAARKVRQISESLPKTEKRLAELVQSGAPEKAGEILDAQRGDSFRATILDKPFEKFAEADAFIKKSLAADMRIGQDRQIGTYAGEALHAHWGQFSEVPDLYLKVGNQTVESHGPSLLSLHAALRDVRNKMAPDLETRVDSDRATLERMRSAAEEPFHMADQLAGVEKQLADLETDIAANPVAPPFWLRSGAPAETLVRWNDKEFTVAGHRWTDDGYFVLAEDAEGSVAIPYMEARDSQGMTLYEEHPFTAPIVIEKEDKKADGKPADEDLRFTMAAGGSAPLTRESLIAELKAGPAANLVDKLLARGWLEITTAKEFAKQTWVPALGATNGHGKIFLIVDKIPAGRASSVLMHEAFHSGRDALFKGKTWETLMDRLEKLYRQFERSSGQGRAFFDAAFAGSSVASGTYGELSRAKRIEEFGAYAVEAYDRAPGAAKRWVDDLVGAVKAWVLRRFRRQLGNITPAQLHALAVAALRDRSRYQFPTEDERIAAFEKGLSTRRAAARKGRKSPKGFRYQVAFHGTPHEFDEFSLDHTGKGEGTRAFGWGLYFASRREVAEHYQDKLSGRLVKVDVPEDNELLRWDEPLNRQPGGLLKKLNQAMSKLEPGLNFKAMNDMGEAVDELTFMQLYHRLEDGQYDEDGSGFSDRQISEALRAAGIPGHKFLDGDSRKDREDPDGTYNYVIYDESRVRVLDRNALTRQQEYESSDEGFDFSLAGALPPAAARAPLTTERITTELRGKLTDLQPWALRAVPLNYFPELARPNMTAVTDYLKVKRLMDAFRGKKHSEMDEIAQAWLKYARLGKDKTAALADLMHESTLAGVDPSNTANDEKPGYAVLRGQYLALPPAGKALYAHVRDAYKAQAAELDKILLDNVRKAQEIASRRAEERYKKELERIASAKLSKEARKDAEREASEAFSVEQTRAKWSMKARLTKMRIAFENSRVEEPYFPLGRFGRYFVTVRDIDGTVISFSRKERAADRDRLAVDMRAAYPLAKVEVGVTESGGDLRSAMDPRMVAEIEEILGGANVDSSVMDQIWQRYLETMPDLSTRKRFIHRKGTAGFHEDALRTFSSHMFHSAHQMGRLKYGLELQELTNKVADQARESDDVTRGMTLSNELRKRHQWVMNPIGGKVAQVMTSTAFVWYLGTTPAAAAVNMTQTPMLGIPILGARFGGLAKAAAAIAKASKDSVAGRGSVTKANLAPDERKALDAFYESGLIDRTQAHDIAGVGETGVEYSPVRAKVMAIMSYLFHKAEVWNREVTALAAYRMAKASGQNDTAAIDTAHDLTWKVHFDYSNASRPRLLQSDFAKVALVFRSHNINMLYRLGRDLHQSFKGETPQARKEARYQLAGIVGMMSLLAGTTGVVGFNLAMTVLGSLFGDEDDPMDFEVTFKKNVIDILGPELGGVVLHGAPGHYLGVDLTGRIGMPDLWFRSPYQDLQGKDEFQYWVMSQLGASVAMVGDMYFGLSLLAEGKTDRAAEALTPKFARDLLRSYRYMNEGIVSLGGDQVLDPSAIDAWDAIAQAVGFTPAKVAETYDRNSALKTAEKRLQRRRQSLINDFALAVKMGDKDGRADALEAIKRFNRAPMTRPMAIKPDTLQRSLKMREANARKREDGVLIQNKKLGRDLRERLPAPVYR